MDLKYFTDQEVKGLQNPLPEMLDKAHELADEAMAEATKNPSAYVKMILTFTTGGLHCGHSAHYAGLAVDIGLGHLTEGFERDTVRWAIMKGLYAVNFKRIEDAPAHIHADIGTPPDYPAPVAWIGKDT